MKSFSSAFSFGPHTKTLYFNNSLRVPLRMVKVLTILTKISFFISIQIIFDGFTVGRYDEGLDENNDFETTQHSLTTASGSEACKFSFLLKINLLMMYILC